MINDYDMGTYETITKIKSVFSTLKNDFDL